MKNRWNGSQKSEEFPDTPLKRGINEKKHFFEEWDFFFVPRDEYEHIENRNVVIFVQTQNGFCYSLRFSAVKTQQIP